MHCCAHILNLIVQDGLKHIDDSITKVCDSVKYVKGSQVRKQKFLECVKLASMGNKKGLCQDMPTRWNSTYLMLESAIHYHREFQHLDLSDSNYKHCPSMMRLCHSLEQSLLLLTCSSLLFGNVASIRKNLESSSESGDDDYLQHMVDQMGTKFQKYWYEFHLTLPMACVLNPRYMLQFVDFSYKKLYGADCLESIRLKNKFSLFEEYTAKKKLEDGTPTCQNTSGPSAHAKEIEMMDTAADALFKEFNEMSTSEFGSSTQKMQGELYLDEPLMHRNMKLDVLHFWKSNQFRYPELATMACDVLAIPVSSVASKACFSVGGRVLDAFRSSLKPNMAETLVCTKDWLFGEKGSEEEVEDLMQDIFKFSLKDEEPFSQGSTSAVADEVGTSAPVAVTTSAKTTQ